MVCIQCDCFSTFLKQFFWDEKSETESWETAARKGGGKEIEEIMLGIDFPCLRCDVTDEWPEERFSATDMTRSENE